MSTAIPFEILPAIDLRGGRVVRLRQGDFRRETPYRDDPVSVARGFAEAGARWLHVVDLDGARTGEPVNGSIVRAIVEAVGERVWVEVAGGLRTVEAVGAILAAGVARAVVGTAALRDPGIAADLVALHGRDRIAVALDVRGGLALGEGWREGAPGVPVEMALCTLADAGVTVFEVTAIDRDGGLEGPDLALYERLVALDRGGIIASGGVSSLDDLRATRDRGCIGAIVGRALLDGTMDLRAALVGLER